MYIDVHTCMIYKYSHWHIMNLAIEMIVVRLDQPSKASNECNSPLPPTLHMLFSHGHTGFKQAVS